MNLARILKPSTWFGKQSASKGWLSFGSSSDGSWRNNPQWFQMGDGPPSSFEAMQVSTVYACVKLISEEVARLNLDHLKPGENGGNEKATNSVPFRVLRSPNRYQTRSDFILYMMMQLLLTGNAYAVATRDRAGSVNSLHPLPGKGCTPHVVMDTGEVFYHFSTFDLSRAALSEGTMVPQRDVLHIRLFTPTHPLIGQSPLVAAAMAMMSQQNIKMNTNEFFANMSRPAGLLTTPKALPPEAAKRLKVAWEEAQNGKTPILDNEITYQPFTMSAVESDMVGQFNLSVKEIASVFRVPLDYLGEEQSIKYASVEIMQHRFIAQTLGFYLEHLENAFDKFFDLPHSENVRFDLESGMMRSDLKTRMEAYKIAVTGAIYTPDEARSKENLKPLPGGNRAYMQQQNWPLEMLGTDPNGAEPAPDTPDDDDDEDDDDEKAIAEMTRYMTEKILEVKAA